MITKFFFAPKNSFWGMVPIVPKVYSSVVLIIVYSFYSSEDPQGKKWSTRIYRT